MEMNKSTTSQRKVESEYLKTDRNTDYSEDTASRSSVKKYVFVVWTQAHFHFFKNIIRELRQSAEVHVLVRRFKNLESLFEETNIPYHAVAVQRRTIFGKVFEYLLATLKTIYRVIMLRPDMIIGVGSTAGSIASFLSNKPSVMFEDDEVTTLQQMTYVPFVSHVLIPEKFRRSFGRKEIRLKSYKELAYLHPNWFSSDKNVLREYGISSGDAYAVVRLNTWDAYHDVGASGINEYYVKDLVDSLSCLAKVLLSTERRVPDELCVNLIKNPNHLHDLLAHASLLFTDTQTMATEAAMLGTPVVRCNTFVGQRDMSNFRELEMQYELIFNIGDFNAARAKAVQLLKERHIRLQWARKRTDMLNAKIDITGFLDWFVRCYPGSARIMSEDPSFQLRFV